MIAVRDQVQLLGLSARSLAGRMFWVLPIVPVAWPLFLGLRILVGWRDDTYSPWEAQSAIAVPLTVLGILLGVRIIAGELDKRTLEIAYTVPGGTQRLWLAKFVAGVLMLFASELLVAGTVFLLLTEFPLGALYGALQAPVFYMAVAMGLAALFKSEVAGVMSSILVWLILLFFTATMGGGSGQIRMSPFWNPAVPGLADFEKTDVLAWTVQNRIGFALAIAALVALAMVRAERREKLLSG